MTLNMTSPQSPKPIWPERYKLLLEFVGVSEHDLSLIRKTGPIVVKYAVQLTDEIYELIFNFPSAKQFFVKEDGSPDHKRIKDNKDTMIQWLYYLSNAPTNDAFARYLAAISSMHRSVPSHRPGLPSVPSQYVLGSISFYQTRLAEIFQNELTNKVEAHKASMAWNKLLIVSLDLLLGSYLTHS
ncbi:hypothetical protein FIM04_04950 [SAR202 cluster bacterium AC-409-J13_OGT_754m]|nr:hypothetical protein [SAR202 cluster bacterium AC-409-J13_OGT_754m]